MGRRALLVAAVGVGLGLAGPGAAAAQDSVEGTALACRQPPDGCLSLPPGQFGTLVQLTADAQSGPGGESPAGTMRWDERFVGGFSHSDTNVTCLSVTGNTAVVGVTGIRRITNIVGSIDVVIAGLIRIVDGGTPGSGLDTIELDIDQGLPTPPTPPLPGPTDCSAFPAGLPTDTADDGNLVVHDAQALPTSKAQCRNGGWRTYGVFKSQGDCVSFVTPKARQACVFELVAHGLPAFRTKYGIGPQHGFAMWSCIHRRIGP
jgi:hypothetical protein